MIHSHKEYLKFVLPDHWHAEEKEDNLFIYDSNGVGAITISFFSVLDLETSLDEQISILAKKFIDRNKICLCDPFILLEKDSKSVLYGTGSTSDGWFVKLWVVAKEPRIVFATYHSERKTKEVKICDSIMDSMCFVL